MAFCANCGTQMSDTAVACPSCGHPTAQTGAYAVVPRTEGLAITSLVLGIAGFFVCPFVLSILAIVFGNQARTKIRNDPSLGGEPLARAGIILGWIGIGVAVIVIVVFILFFAAGTAIQQHNAPAIPSGLGVLPAWR